MQHAAMLVGVAVGFLVAHVSTTELSATAKPLDVVTTIGASTTLMPGETTTLYAVRGQRYGTVGRFVVSCNRRGLARTSYEIAESSPTTEIAFDGRGASRGGLLLHARLPGGVRPSGIEHWQLSTGGEPESIGLDAFLRVLSISAPGDSPRARVRYCEFALGGKLASQPTA